MRGEFTFLRPRELADGDLELILVGKHSAYPIKKYIPWYGFEMRNVRTSSKIGAVRLCIGPARCLRYPGHVGYFVKKKYRGRRYAARSCKLLFPLAYAHGLKALWITCDAKNEASR